MRESIKGRPVAVLASGPSLALEDVELLRRHGIPMIAVNSTWEMVPDCYAIYAGDYRWWQAYGNDVTSDAPRFSRSKNAQRKYGAKATKTRVRGAYNSGMAAIEWAVMKGASPVLLLGFDCSLKQGIHWHGEHTKTPNPNKSRVLRWHDQFRELRRLYKRAEILNCSRYTELEMFPIHDLEQTIESLAKSEIHS